VDGCAEGPKLGDADLGAPVIGDSVGSQVPGLELGVCVGSAVTGALDGDIVGSSVGDAEDGPKVGLSVGLKLGASDPG